MDVPLHKLKYDFEFNMPLSEELCEFLGCFIGDGFTNKYNRTGQTQFAGDSRFDQQYYKEIIIPRGINRRSHPITHSIKRGYNGVFLTPHTIWYDFSI